MTIITDKIAASGIPTNVLAEDAGVPYWTVYRWKNGTSQPRADQIPGLARALGLTTSDLIPDCELPVKDDKTSGAAT